MRNVWILAKRELTGYFATPVAYVFLFFYLVLLGGLTFELGGFYEGEQADLQRFFTFHPWLYLLLIPAISMGLWAEERKSGTLELLMTLPVTMGQCVTAKFLAAWAFVGLALLLTFPMWITVNYLGKPDNGVIIASYLGSFLLAGGYLAIGTFFSALTKSQVVAFVLTFFFGFGVLLLGTPLADPVMSPLPGAVSETIRSFSFLAQFDAVEHGVIDLRTLTFFGSLIVCGLIANAIALDLKKAD